jgi:hypothetical protein
VASLPVFSNIHPCSKCTCASAQTL